MFFFSVRQSKRLAQTFLIALGLATMLSAFLPTRTAYAVDLVAFEKALGSTGAEGSIHGASAPLGVYVISYRNPENFFDYLEMSMVAGNPTVAKQLASLNRHDRVRIKGSFLPNSSRQKHILITSLEVLGQWSSPYKPESYKYDAKLPEELATLTEAEFLVHGVHAEGRIFIVEYKDAVIPIPVTNNELTKNLSRNDLVRLKFKIQSYPGRPMHLRLDETAADAVQVLESVQALHGTRVDFEGALVMFPQAPGIRFNVFAALHESPSGARRQYTIINFSDMALFAEIREKLQQAWDRHPGAYMNGRNKLVSTVVRVRVRGVFNQIDPNQANSQIMPDTLEDVSVIEK